MVVDLFAKRGQMKLISLKFAKRHPFLREETNLIKCTLKRSQKSWPKRCRIIYYGHCSQIEYLLQKCMQAIKYLMFQSVS